MAEVFASAGKFLRQRVGHLLTIFITFIAATVYYRYILHRLETTDTINNLIVTTIGIILGCIGIVVTIVFSIRSSRILSNIQDATRHVIYSFENIFIKPKELITTAEREIWIVNFTPHFGLPWIPNKRVSDSFQNITGDDFKQSVDILWNTLKTKISDAHIKINIITSTQLLAKQFLMVLSEKDGFHNSKNSSNLNIVETLHNMKKDIDELLSTKNGRSGSKKEDVRICFSNLLPFQLFIAFKPKNRIGCLVFLIGTPNTDVPTGSELSFYTENEAVANIFKKYAEDLLKHCTNKMKEKNIPTNGDWHTDTINKLIKTDIKPENEEAYN